MNHNLLDMLQDGEKGCNFGSVEVTRSVGKAKFYFALLSFFRNFGFAEVTPTRKSKNYFCFSLVFP